MGIENVVGASDLVSTTKVQETNDTSSLDGKIEQLKKQIEQINKNKKLSQEEKDKRITNIENQVAKLEQQSSQENNNIPSAEMKKRFDTYEAQPQQQSAGIYQVAHDEEGNKIIQVDKSLETAQEQPKAEPQDDSKKSNNDGEEPTIVKTTVNTDKVDNEIKKLKQKQAQLEQKIASAKNQNDKESLETQLAQVEAELKLKDNDTYRRQHMQITEQKVVSKVGE